MNDKDYPLPRPIEDNPIRRQLDLAEQVARAVYEKKFCSAIICGPPGIGKTTMLNNLAREYRGEFTFVRPASNPGLLELLYEHRRGGVLVMDDVNAVWKRSDMLATLKIALDTQRRRTLRHDVKGKANKIQKFDIHCGVIFLSNKDFGNPKDFGKLWKADVEPMVRRNGTNLVNLGFDPLDIYEYTGHVATDGQMLKRLTWDLPKGQSQLSLIQSNEVLAHFAEYAPHYPDLTPRGLEMVARWRIGISREEWLKVCDNMLTPEPQWPELLQRKLPLFQCVSARKSTKASTAVAVIDPVLLEMTGDDPPDWCPYHPDILDRTVNWNCNAVSEVAAFMVRRLAA